MLWQVPVGSGDSAPQRAHVSWNVVCVVIVDKKIECVW